VDRRQIKNHNEKDKMIAHPAPVSPPTGPGQQPDLVQAFTAAFTTDDVEGFYELIAPDAEWIIMATGETFRGPDQIRDLATRSIAARDHPAGMGIKPFNIFTNADGTRLCWEYVHTAIVTDKWPSSTNRPPIGTTIGLPIILSCEIRAGKIIKAREYFDMWGLVDPGNPHHLYS
jgi:limonene-1,2-epoxide hydrolase